MADDYEGISGPEKMFRQELDACGASIDAMIIRPPRDWAPDYYCYQLTMGDGSKKTGMVEWGLETFATIIKIAKGA